jgi:hypothetical protein
MALIVTLLLIGLLTALGLAMSMIGTMETWLSVGRGTSEELAYAAEAAVARVEVDLAAAADWTPMVTSSASSGLDDGARTTVIGDGSGIDLPMETERLQAAMDAACGSAVLNPDCPQWHLFAHDRVERLAPGFLVPPVYVAVWIADDQGDADANPAVDSNGRLLVRGIAFGPGGARRSVEILAARPPAGGVQVLAWSEPR